jgi:hypothetical protein
MAVQVPSAEEAEVLMNSDPAVRGILTAALYPYSIAYNDTFSAR